MGTTAINSAVETAGLSFLAIYAMRLGWNETEGAQLITVLMVGAIALQLPIGWLSDKMNRVTLMIALTAVSAITAFLWPLLLSVSWLAYPALFIWGGIFVGIYTTMLAIIGSQFRGADLISVYAAMGLFWGGGALVGPMLAGGFLDVMQHGLPTFVGMVCVVFMVFALIVKRTLKPSGAPGMIRIVLILLGREIIQRHWKILLITGGVWLLLGTFIAIDALDGKTIIPSRFLAISCCRRRLSASWLPRSVRERRDECVSCRVSRCSRSPC
ncbi:MFS transporter [Ochrobactrum oryzae]|nr:MFS transporter [Brucella oryzae]